MDLSITEHTFILNFEISENKAPVIKISVIVRVKKSTGERFHAKTFLALDRERVFYRARAGRGERLKIQVQPGSEIFDLSVEKLSVGRISVVVFKQETDLSHKTSRPFKLKAAADGDLRVPFVFLPGLDVQSRNKAGCIAPESRGLQFYTGLRRPRLDPRWIEVKQVSAAAIKTKPMKRPVGQYKVYAFETEIDPIDSVAQKEFIAKMGALMEDSKKSRKIIHAVTRLQRGEKVGVDQIR